MTSFSELYGVYVVVIHATTIRIEALLASHFIANVGILTHAHVEASCCTIGSCEGSRKWGGWSPFNQSLHVAVFCS